MIDLIKKLLILSSIIFVSCNNMVEGVNKSDTQKINTVKYGTLVAAEPVKIKGEDVMDWVPSQAVSWEL
jgi:outer membrane lipoprotein SlyB